MNNITDYLQNDPVHYDFSDDCTKSREYQAKKGLDKYFIYKSGKGDPDTKSRLLQSIYSLLWPEIKEQKSEYMVNSNGWIYSDTMTSVQTTLNSYIGEMPKDSYIGRKMSEVLKKYGKNRVSSKMCIECYNTDPEFRSLLDTNKDFVHFIDVYHTLGNYIPVSRGFNTARSGIYGSHDYWDLTLMKIKEYYDAQKIQSGSGCFFTSPEVKIMELLHGKGEVVCCCKWLNSFGGWEDFIDRNFLQDFVGADNQPIPLCEGHSWEYPEVLNFDEFFKNAWQMIEKRSARMIEMLEKKAP